MYQLEDTRNIPQLLKAHLRETAQLWKVPGNIMSIYLAFIASAWRL